MRAESCPTQEKKYGMRHTMNTISYSVDKSAHRISSHYYDCLHSGTYLFSHERASKKWSTVLRSHFIPRISMVHRNVQSRDTTQLINFNMVTSVGLRNVPYSMSRYFLNIASISLDITWFQLKTTKFAIKIQMYKNRRRSPRSAIRDCSRSHPHPIDNKYPHVLRSPRGYCTL